MENTRKILTIPNLLSVFRLVLAGLFAWVYCHAETREDYLWAVGVLVLSGLTDFADGKIARGFHMISELGKILDPIADKLTQVVVAFCLCRHYQLMWLLLAVLVGKELCQGCYGLLAIRQAGYNDGAMWCGKVTTFYLYAMMVVLLVAPGLPQALSGMLILVGVGLLLWSFGSYVVKFRWMVREAKAQGEGL